jgi:hypothetical protein
MIDMNRDFWQYLSMEYFNIKGNLFQVKIEGGYRN